MSAPEPLPAAAPVEIVGERFAIETRVAAGAMGEVFRAHDRETGAPVALKRMQATRDAARFSDECEVLKRLEHASIVRYVAHGTGDDGRPWLAMEWLEGEDLASRLARADATIAESVAWVRGIAEGLAAAHALGIVHRDIKPENVVLVPDAAAPSGHRVKIVDFGLARTGGARAATRTGVILGTPAYMAPEQVRADKDIDARVDVFALGCIAFECIAGRPAFVAESLLATFAKILFEDRAPLWREKPGTPRAISDLVARMMAKERADRPVDAAAVVAALAALGDLREDGDLGSGERVRPALPAALEATLPDEASEPVQTSTAEPAAPAIEALRVLAGRESMQVLGIDDDHIIGNAWNVSVLVWGKRTTLHAIAGSERAILAHAARFPEGIGLLTVVEEIAEIPNDEERKALSVLLSSLSGKVKRSAVAHEGTGFRAAAVRGVATGLTLLARVPFPHRTFEGMEPAVAWMMEGLPERPVEAPVVLAAAREMRRLFDAHRAR
jgi:uncharacterized protein (DUF2267 family)